MTKQNAIEKTKRMLEILQQLPDSENIDILSADANEYMIPPADIRIHFNSGIEDVEKIVDVNVVNEYLDSSNDVHRIVQSENCEYVQIFQK